MNINFDAKDTVLEAVAALGKAVGSTMGPGGALVMIPQPNAAPILTKDGFHVAKALKASDPIIDMIFKLILQGMRKTVLEAGDATTCTAVLIAALLKATSEQYKAGRNLPLLITEINAATKDAQTHLLRMRVNVPPDDLYNVALISANGDKDLAAHITTAVNTTGSDGLVVIEESAQYETTVSYTSGYSIDAGYINRAFINEPAKLRTVLNNPLIWIINKPLLTYQDAQALMPILEWTLKANRPLVILAPDFAGDPLATLVTNASKLQLCAIKLPNAPDFSLDDLAAILGATVRDPQLKDPLRNINPQTDFGTAAQLTVNANTTMISGAKANQTYIDQLKQELAEDPDPVKRHFGPSRLARLAASIATIRIGGFTAAAIKATKDSADDCVLSVKAAQKHGILPGGGTALLKVADKITPSNPGASALIDALKAPFHTIITNAGITLDSSTLADIKGYANTCYDINTHIIVDAFKAGILDPYTAITQALDNAVAVINSILKVNVVLNEKS